MPRRSRSAFSAGTYAVSASAVAGLELFRDANDVHAFERILERAAERHGWAVREVQLRRDGYEFVVELRGAEPRLTEGMRLVNGQYGAFVNRRYGRSGHVFGARYRVQPV